MSYRDRFVSLFSDPRMKLPLLLITLGGPISLGCLLFCFIPLFFVSAVILHHGSFGEQVAQEFNARGTVYLVLIGVVLLNCVSSLVAFRQLKRIEPQAQGAMQGQSPRQ